MQPIFISMTFATKRSAASLRRDTNVPEVALISGHRDPRMLFRYTHPKTSSIVEKLSGRT